MLLVADNLQAVKKKIYHAIESLDPEPIADLVVKCEQAGAEIIDINAGPLTRDPEKKMAFLVDTVQSVTELPIMLDTANAKAMEAGLKVSVKSAIINGFSLEKVKLEGILPLAKKYKTDIIGYLLYPNSHVPMNASDRLGVAIELFQAVQKTGIDAHHLIIDPVVVPVSWQNGNFQAKEILTVIRDLPDLLGFNVKTIAGLSNLTTGYGHMEKKCFLEKTYLPMLAAAGLDLALLNIFHSETIKTARACESLIAPNVFSWEEIQV